MSWLIFRHFHIFLQPLVSDHSCATSSSCVRSQQDVLPALPRWHRNSRRQFIPRVVFSRILLLLVFWLVRPTCFAREAVPRPVLSAEEGVVHLALGTLGFRTRLYLFGGGLVWLLYRFVTRQSTFRFDSFRKLRGHSDSSHRSSYLPASTPVEGCLSCERDLRRWCTTMQFWTKSDSCTSLFADRNVSYYQQLSWLTYAAIISIAPAPSPEDVALGVIVGQAPHQRLLTAPGGQNTKSVMPAPNSRKSSTICAPGWIPFLLMQRVMNSDTFHISASIIYWISGKSVRQDIESYERLEPQLLLCRQSR
jgi:hypothetical protein